MNLAILVVFGEFFTLISSYCLIDLLIDKYFRDAYMDEINACLNALSDRMSTPSQRALYYLCQTMVSTYRQSESE